MRLLANEHRYESERQDKALRGQNGVPPHIRYVLALQARAGNMAVSRLFSAESTVRTIQRCGDHECEGDCGSDAREDDAVPGVQRLLPPVLETSPTDALHRAQVATEVLRSPDGGLRAGDGLGKVLDNAEELMKASTAVASGAPPSMGLGAGDYGLTFPESVDVQISAKLNTAAKTWSPVVQKLTGRYSQQTRLLPGQFEITGPGGNTTSAVYCDQVTNLKSIGNTVGNIWYVLEAVRRHERVHEKRFGPALKDAELTITTDLEAVTIADVPGMTTASAVIALQADASFKAAVTKAQQTWLAAILVRVAGDHAAGGPTDAAEKKVTEPLRTKICAHAKKKGWPACADC